MRSVHGKFLALFRTGTEYISSVLLGKTKKRVKSDNYYSINGIKTKTEFSAPCSSQLGLYLRLTTSHVAVYLSENSLYRQIYELIYSRSRGHVVDDSENSLYRQICELIYSGSRSHVVDDSENSLYRQICELMYSRSRSHVVDDSENSLYRQICELIYSRSRSHVVDDSENSLYRQICELTYARSRSHVVDDSEISLYRQICDLIYSLKGLSHEIDFKNFDKNLQNLA